MAKLIAVTSCPTGIAHTFMAADALKKAAAAAGDEIAVETQGSVGAKNQLTPEQIAAADLVIIAADTHVDPARFAGKPLYTTSVGAAVKGAADLIARAKVEATLAGGTAPTATAAKATTRSRLEGSYKHLLTGVSYMLPIVVAGGLCIALSFVFGIEAFKEEGTLAAALMAIGGGAAFKLMVPILSGYIAYSIADRPGLTPGLIGGMMAVDMGGPVNKAAYTFAVGLLTSDTFMPMAVVMAAGMTPPLGISLATLIGGNRFTQAEREAGKAAGVLGLSFITEGAIPFAAKDPLRVIPAAVLGSAAAGALSMYFAVGLRAPHGGVFVLAIPNAVTHLAWYALAIVVGTLLTTIALLILKPSLNEPKPVLVSACVTG
ncbi:fructose-specific PTS transporter subunit EIIC [uncultured Lamprocystis sp.]|jgi:fructose-specific phosphotransferase system IIB component|uniref:fructose-specific PTS transporter subunit EIIC n=1 Tax=uncultured Lamprocystis sp. TaxID=543132 RepID=UPI0025E18B89|nr:fructose-specific PTS transporter subunit EIIC [uncultured Lamprocystis sp.]